MEQEQFNPETKLGELVNSPPQLLIGEGQEPKAQLIHGQRNKSFYSSIVI